MVFNCSNNAYKMFICYRRAESNPNLAASEHVAGMLHWWLNFEPHHLAKGNPVLFEECFPTGGGLTYAKEGIQKFMPPTKTCFVVLCPGFFKKCWTRIMPWMTSMMTSPRMN